MSVITLSLLGVRLSKQLDQLKKISSHYYDTLNLWLHFDVFKVTTWINVSRSPAQSPLIFEVRN